MCEEDGQGKARSLAWREVTGWAKRGGNLTDEVQAAAKVGVAELELELWCGDGCCGGSLDGLD